MNNLSIDMTPNITPINIAASIGFSVSMKEKYGRIERFAANAIYPEKLLNDALLRIYLIDFI